MILGFRHADFLFFHWHHISFDRTKFVIEYQHSLDNGKVGKCPYADCTKQFRIFYCKCGKEMDREEYKFKDGRKI